MKKLCLAKKMFVASLTTWIAAISGSGTIPSGSRRLKWSAMLAACIALAVSGCEQVQHGSATSNPTKPSNFADVLDAALSHPDVAFDGEFDSPATGDRGHIGMRFHYDPAGRKLVTKEPAKVK